MASPAAQDDRSVGDGRGCGSTPTGGSSERAANAPALVLDLDRCIGCWACAIACRMKNDLPAGTWWLRVEEERIGAPNLDAGLVERFRPVVDRCNYSTDDVVRRAVPACAVACPTQVFTWGAASDLADDVVERLERGAVSTTSVRISSGPTVHYASSRSAVSQRRSGLAARPSGR